jgi:ribosomal protein L21E
MAQIIDLGKIRFNWAGNYNSETEYSYNDLVKYGPNLYAYINAIATDGNVPTDTTFWVVVVEGIEYRGTYENGTLYYKNDVVTDTTSTFIVVTQHTSTSNIAEGNPNLEIIALGQDGIPNQTGQVNKLLTTDGVDPSWTAVPKLTKLYVGNGQGQGALNFEAAGALTDTMSVFSFSSSDFAQFAIVNTTDGANSSTDFIAYSANGDNDSGWIDMGITSQSFSEEEFGITGPNDGYIFMSGPRSDEKDVVSLLVAGSTATVTTGTVHGFEEGDLVKISGVSESIDGVRTITAVPATNQFQFTTTAAPQSDLPVVPFGSVFKPFGNGNLVLATDLTGKENKIIFAAGGFESGTTQMEITPDVNVHIEIPTESTDSSTGALTVVGGVGIQGSTSVQGLVRVDGNIYAGEGAELFETNADLTNAKIVLLLEGDPYAQVAIQNPTATSSGDVIIYADNGTDLAGWIDLGVTGSKFEQAEFGITKQNDGYVFLEAPTPIEKTVTNKAKSSGVVTITTSTAHGFEVGNQVEIDISDSAFDGAYTITNVGSNTFTYNKTGDNVSESAASGTATKKGTGNLVIATGANGTENKIVLAAGGFDSGRTQLEITPDVNVHVEIDTPSVSPTTGALTIVGGVGIVGDVNIQGSITFGGTGTEVSTENLSVEAAMIYVGADNPADLLDLGIVAEYTSSGTKYAGLVRDASDGVFKLFEDAETKPVTTVNFSESGLGFATIKVAAVDLDEFPTSPSYAVPKSYVDQIQLDLETAQFMGAF